MPGSSLSRAATTLRTAAGWKPKMESAEMASSATALSAAEMPPPPSGRHVELSVAQERPDLVAQVEHNAGGRFRPDALHAFEHGGLFALNYLANSAGVKAESTMRAVCPPMPLTDISASKSVRSCLDEKP